MKIFELDEILKEFVVAMLLWFVFLFVALTVFDMATEEEISGQSGAVKYVEEE